MKQYLYFNHDGSYQELKTSKENFQIEDYTEYNSHKKYPEYFVLYNDNVKLEKNIVLLPFTTDLFNGSIIVIKHKDEKITSFTFKKYLRLISVNIVLEEIKDSDSDSDCDPFDQSCNLSEKC